MAKEDARHKTTNARLSQLQRTSNTQEMLYKFLEDLKVDFYKEGERTKIGYYVFDCLIPAENGGGLLIECQGDYWHSLPRTQRSDKSKFTYIERYHPEYKIMYVWEHEFYSNGRVLDRIKKSLSLDLEHVAFEYDQIEIKAVAASELRTFLDAYHYIGAGRWGAAFGAYIDGKLVGVTVLSDPLRQNMAEQFKSASLVEISRVCIHPSYHKRNFASWFVSRCMKLHGRHDYLAYADSTVGHKGIIYKALGFKMHHEVPSDYWYVDVNGFAMHKKTLYNRAVKMSMKESEFAERNGYVKKYGGIKYCYIKQH
jgi:GNAT superfamily N-acetyltransferase